jgi:hypothetical protein
MATVFVPSGVGGIVVQWLTALLVMTLCDSPVAIISIRPHSVGSAWPYLAG